MPRIIIIISTIATMLAGCGSNNMIVQKGTVLGTRYEISVDPKGLNTKIVKDLIDQSVKSLEARYELIASKGDFMVSLNEDRSISAPAAFAEVVVLAQKIHDATFGAYDYRLGSVRQLWGLNSSELVQPNAEELASTLFDAENLTIEIKDGKASLEGSGKIDFGALASGSAVDEAANVLLAGGVERAKVTLGIVSRFWGGQLDGKASWQFVLPPLPADTIYKVLTPPDGAISIYHPAINGIDAGGTTVCPIIDPTTGLISSSAIASVGWADVAASAGAYSEALFTMGRRKAFNWAGNNQPAGLFLIYIDPVDSLALCETDANLATSVNDSLPAGY